MSPPRDPNVTADIPADPHHPNAPPGSSPGPDDSLDAGLAVGFGRGEPPRSSMGAVRPVLLKEVEGESALVVKPKSDAMPTPAQTGDRYQLSGEIARGGMGAVLRGRDVDLGRDLAVKVLLEKHAHRPEVARRFIEEAQIGGQLQHPGVVPVYDIGRFGDRPYFTMKLVRGQTLQALLGERADPAVDRPRFLAIALQIAQTLAYAHDKGVIHRDLKPANIMVGNYGEVQVVDWGLGKVLAEGGIADEERASRGHQEPGDVTHVRTARSSGTAGSFGTETEAGSLLGTPAYMPPEQANGDIANLDRRADVFGLGAILCEILTGKPPYVGRSGEEVRRKAANADLVDAHARLGACGADPELVALTRACLAPEFVDRPKDARAVTDGLTAHLDGVQHRLRTAELTAVAARVRAAEEIKRRRLTVALAGAGLVVVLLGGGGGAWIKADRDGRRAAVARDVNEALNQATTLREQARAAPTGGAQLLARAREQSQRAAALIENGPADSALVSQVRQLQSDLEDEEKDRALASALDAARLVKSQTDGSTNRFAAERAIPLFQEAFRVYGLPAGEDEPGAAAARIRARPPAVRETILAALDDWEIMASSTKVPLVEPHREWLRAVLDAAEPGDGFRRKVRAARGETDEGTRRAALDALAAGVDVGTVPPGALASLAPLVGTKQGIALMRRAQWRYPADFSVNTALGHLLRNETVGGSDDAVRFFGVAVALRPDTPGAILNLGLALQDKRRLDEAEGCFRRAVELDPKYTAARVGLGKVLREKGDLAAALACYRSALELDPGDSRLYGDIGTLLHLSGRFDEAVTYHRRAIDLAPKTGAYYGGLATTQRQMGLLEEAYANIAKAVELDPTHDVAQNNMGSALMENGKWDEAIVAYRRSIALNPLNPDAYWNLADALDLKGESVEAVTCRRKAIEIPPESAVRSAQLGDLLAARGEIDEAVLYFRKAVALEPRSGLYPLRLGDALVRKGRLDEAIVCYRTAVARLPDHAAAHVRLGVAVGQKGGTDEAIASLRTALELDPMNAETHSNLGALLGRKGQQDEAVVHYRAAMTLDPKSPIYPYNLGRASLALRNVDDAIVAFRNALEIDPRFAPAHASLGGTYYDLKQDYAAAVTTYRALVALTPGDPNAHFNLGLALNGMRQPEAALAALQASLDLAPTNAMPHCLVGHILLRQGRFAEALAAYRRGHELGSKRPGWREPSAEWVRTAEEKVAREKQLLAFYRGDFRPTDTAGRIALAEVCQAKKLYVTAARLFAAAFAADPKAAANLKAASLYDAACVAALAATGRAEDGAKIDEAERTRLRKQALDWLRAELPQRRGQLTAADPTERTQAERLLGYWKKDPDLASVRGATALAQLPPAERDAWENLWGDLEAVLKKAEQKGNPERLLGPKKSGGTPEVAPLPRMRK